MLKSFIRLPLAVCLAAVFAHAPGRAAEIEGVEFADRYQSGSTALALSGVGLLRYRIFLKGYVAALYLADGVSPDRALDDVPRRLEIEYFWSIPAEAFAEATVEGIGRNVDSEAFGRMSGQISLLNELYRDVKPGDRYSLTYRSGSGTELAKNGEALGVVEGADFSSALFSIWLGARSLNDSLRDQLLSRP